MANTQNKKQPMDKDLNFVNEYGWKMFLKTGIIDYYGMAKGAQQVQAERNKERENAGQMGL